MIRKRTAALAVTALVGALVSAVIGATASVSPAGAAPAASAPAASAPGTYVALSPARVFDGRADGVAAPHATVSVPVLGHGGIPSTGVAAIALTLTAAGQTSSGYVTAYPAGKVRPTTSNLNFVPGQNVANSVVVPAGSGGEVDLYNGSAGSTDFVVDVAGYYRSGSATAAGAFTAITPTRRLDTRIGTGGAAPGADGVARVKVGIVDATVLMNLTVTGSAAGGHVAAYPDGAARPVTSNLSFGPGQTIANQIVVAVGANGLIDLYNASAGTTQLILDVVGRYRAGTATAPGALQPIAPQRQLDTRTLPSGPLGARSAFVDPVGGTAGVPASGVSSVLLDVTVVTPARLGYLRVQASGGVGSVPSPTSSLNFAAGRTVAGLVIVAAGAGGNIEFYLRSDGPANVVVDVLGYTLDGPGTSRGSISGIVSVSTGPPNGVVVRAYNGTHIVVSTRTAGDGTYTLAGLLATTAGYDVCVVAPNDTVASRCVDGVQWNGPTPPPDSTPVPVEGGTLRGNVDIQLSEPLPTGVITGRVTAAHTGEPVAGVEVRVEDQFFSIVTTGSDGTYRIDNVTPGSYQVCFTPDNTAAGTPPTGYAAVCHTGDVTVTNGTTGGVNGVLPTGAAVSGRVTAATDATALGNAQVSASFTGAAHFFGATTAADGTYRIIGLTGGTSVTVCFSDTGGTSGPSQAGYLNACYHTGTGTDPTPIKVTAGSTATGIDVALASGGGISGTVRGGTAGVEGVDVFVFSGGFGRDAAESGADGTYTITGMVPGTYTVCFQYDADFGGTPYRDQCYHDVVWDGGSIPAGANPVTVTAGLLTKNIDASLTPQTQSPSQHHR